MAVRHFETSTRLDNPEVIVTDVNYASLSKSIPTVSMWCAHTTNSDDPIAIIAKIILKFRNASLFPLS